MLSCELLLDLNASAVAVHVTKTANVHQDVEAEVLAGAEAAKHFVVASTMTQARRNDLATPRFAEALYRVTNLPVRIIAVLIEQCGCEFHFERLVIEEVDRRGLIYRFAIQ